MRTTAEETQRNDETIITAAIKVFSEKGYDAASMQDIADEANISRGPLYYRYKTKKDIYMAAMDAFAKRELGEQARILRQKIPPVAKMREYLYFATKSIREDINAFPMDFFPDPKMQDVNNRIREIYSWSYEITKRFVQAAIQENELSPDTDVDGFVNIIFVIFDGLRYSRMKSGVIPSDEELEKTVDQICNMLIAGYGIE